MPHATPPPQLPSARHAMVHTAASPQDRPPLQLPDAAHSMSQLVACPQSTPPLQDRDVPQVTRQGRPGGHTTVSSQPPSQSMTQVSPSQWPPVQAATHAGELPPSPCWS